MVKNTYVRCYSVTFSLDFNQIYDNDFIEITDQKN